MNLKKITKKNEPNINKVKLIKLKNNYIEKWR